MIDSFCWLHDAGCGLGRTLYQSPEVGRKLVISKFIERLTILRTSGGEYKWIPHAVFDGAPSPGKATEDAVRRNDREASLNAALKLEGVRRGMTQKAQKLYNKWWRPSFELVHQLCVVLSELCIAFTVAPHEADGQLSYLFAMFNTERPGTVIAITKDSDLAVTIENVFFWDTRYDTQRRLGGGLHCIRSEMLAQRDGKKSLDDFSDDQFMLTCVLAGCDYVSRADHAKGVGFVTAILLVREHKTIDNVVKHLLQSAKYRTNERTERMIRAAICHFKYPVVYDPGTGSHVHRVPIPQVELAKVKAVLGGNLEALGHLWPRQVAQDLANSVVHPLTRLPFVEATAGTDSVPRGGQRSGRTVLLGGRLEDSLRRLPPPPMLAPGPQYQAALRLCDVTQHISPITEIAEDVLVKVLGLRPSDVEGADLFFEGKRTEQEALQHFLHASQRYTIKALEQWLKTRHISRSKMIARGKTQVRVCMRTHIHKHTCTHTYMCVVTENGQRRVARDGAPTTRA